VIGRAHGLRPAVVGGGVRKVRAAAGERREPGQNMVVERRVDAGAGRGCKAKGQGKDDKQSHRLSR
jgi:hypothetical protein